MTRINVQFELPDHLAQEAEAEGLLTPQAIERLLRDEIRRRTQDQLHAHLQRVETSLATALTPRELEAEIEAFRVQRRLADAGGR